MVAIPFSVPTQDIAMKSIEKALAGPSAGDYFSSAQYFYQSNGDLNKALSWVNNAISNAPKDRDVPFWYLRLKSLIQAKIGDKKGAIETALTKLKEAHKSQDIPAIDAAMTEMNTAWTAASEEIYKAQQEAGAQPGADAQAGAEQAAGGSPKNDTVEDAQFEEVK